jgi:hypothetical protein
LQSDEIESNVNAARMLEQNYQNGNEGQISEAKQFKKNKHAPDRLMEETAVAPGWDVGKNSKSSEAQLNLMRREGAVCAG